MPLTIGRLQSEAIDNYGTKDAFNALARFDGVIWYLGQSGNIVFETGGQPDFRERLMYGPNTTIDFRGASAPVPMTDDEGFTLISVPQVMVSGGIVYLQKEVDQVRGNSALAKNLIADKTRQFTTSWPIIVASKLRQASPVGNDPYTLLGASGEGKAILLPQAPASQTATTGGIARSETVTVGAETVRYWANQYSNASMDLTATAGRQSLYLNVFSKCVRGNGAGWSPDFGLIADVAKASLEAAGDANRRYTPDGKALEFGFKNIVFSGATLFEDRSSRFLNGTAGKVAFLNSKALKLKVLQGTGGVTKDMVDEENNLKGLPLFWFHKDMHDWTTFRSNWLAYCTMNLVPLSLQDHGLADNTS